MQTEAESSLQWYRGSEYSIKSELDDLLKKNKEQNLVILLQNLHLFRKIFHLLFVTENKTVKDLQILKRISMI